MTKMSLAARAADVEQSDREYIAQRQAKERAKTAARDAVVTGLARDVLRFTTLETRKSDSLDFKDCAVWDIKEALEKAYEAGVEAQLRRSAMLALDRAFK